MFKRIFVEKKVIDHKITQNILSKFKTIEPELIDKVEDIWGRVKKPYLQKRDNLNLFIGRKEGALIKEAPPAYGKGSEPHYYFVHAYNCIYECEYCYLQGYFNTPDIVLFVNHEDIISEMEKLTLKTNGPLWFHAGEFSDSLALSHLTDEFSYYFDFFKKYKNAFLEFRTKSVNIKKLLNYEPLENIFVSFSLSPEKNVKEHDLKTPPLKLRLKAIEELYKKGFKIGIHLDPVIYKDDFKESYQELLSDLNKHIPISEISYISIGVVRFTKDVYFETKKNYPESTLLQGEFIKSFDNKVRYNRPMRMWILNSLKDLSLSYNIASERVYLCMEEDDLSIQDK